MRQIFFCALVTWTIIFSFYSHAAFEGKKIEKICDIIMSVKEELKESKASEILFIFDVHGILTNDEGPSDEKAVARGDIDKIVKALYEMGIKLIASSAWEQPGQVVNDIVDIDLYKQFEVGETTFNSKKILELENKKIKVDYFNNGNMGSVKIFDDRGKYYRNKAFAPYLVLKDKVSNYKKILFIDDNKINIEQFQYDVKKYELFPKAEKIMCIEALLPFGGEDASDLSIEDIKKKLMDI